MNFQGANRGGNVLLLKVSVLDLDNGSPTTPRIGRMEGA
jgi:hypothetical protein